MPDACSALLAPCSKEASTSSNKRRMAALRPARCVRASNSAPPRHVRGDSAKRSRNGSSPVRGPMLRVQVRQLAHRMAPKRKAEAGAAAAPAKKTVATASAAGAGSISIEACKS